MNTRIKRDGLESLGAVREREREREYLFIQRGKSECYCKNKLNEIIKNEKKIERGDYVEMSIDIRDKRNLLFLCAKKCNI